MATATKTAAKGRPAGTSSKASAPDSAANGTKQKKPGKAKAAGAPAGAGTASASKPKEAKPKAAKAAKAAKPAKAAKAAKGDSTDKPRKPKLVRDSFTIPKAEYLALDQLKARAVRLGRPAKKSEVLRAGLMALAGMADAAFLASITAVPAVKTGRPAKQA